MFDDVVGLAKGFGTTLKHFFRPPVTVAYPDVKRVPADKFRGRHRLYRHPDGLERCIACSLCAAACPSQAIYVGAAENDPDHPTSPGERYAKDYEINMIRCIFCGYCEEACPVDAIKLGPEYELSDYLRKDFVYTKKMLLDPEQYAPRIQYHADVDKSVDFRGVHTTLGEVYRTHHPVGAPDLRDRSYPYAHRSSVHETAHEPESGTPPPVRTPSAGSTTASHDEHDEKD
ncbi:MAG: NADH-quinone oxidoreductase subunit NuoI [Chloroflexi bacterium]|nr:NADH-quinone oxidoreductase subunit NuoI [Chloroflexota bacterium]